ncbi:MAG: hypothetical protein ACRERC_06170 [Candidatus Binatia bacterium]
MRRAARLAPLAVVLLIAGCGNDGSDGGIEIHGDIGRRDVAGIVRLLKADEPTYPVLTIYAQSFPSVTVWAGWICGNVCGVFHVYKLALVDGAWVIRTREDWIS